MMTKITLSLLFVFVFVQQAYTQNVGIGTSTPDASALLDLSASNQGLLLPRMTAADMILINSPANGLLVFNTTEDRLYYYNQFLGSWFPVAEFPVTGDGDKIIDKVDGNTRLTMVDSATIEQMEFEIAGSPVLRLKQNGQGDLLFDHSSTSVFFGDESGKFNLGNYNTFIGSLSGENNQGGFSNTFIGSYAGRNNSEGNYNVLIGDDAGQNNLSGEANTAIGEDALYQNQTGNSNVAIGRHAGYSNVSAFSNIAIGVDALYSNNLSNTIAIGDSALYHNQSGPESYYGTRNTAVGSKAMLGNTWGSWNTALGFQSLESNTTGQDNTVIGLQALAQNKAGHRNTAIGVFAGYNNLGNNNTLVGKEANYYNQDGGNNTILGYQAGYGSSNHNKSGNVFIGFQAGYNEQGNNRLYIDNSSTSNPLIFGDFNSDQLNFNCNVGVNNNNPQHGIHLTDRDVMIDDGTIPAIKLAHHGFGSGGEIEMYDTDGTRTIYMLAAQSTNAGSFLEMRNGAGDLKMFLDGDENGGSQLVMYDANGASSISLVSSMNGDGRITTDEIEIKGGSDFAEMFDIKTDSKNAIRPGMLVSIDPHQPGELKVTAESRDKKIVGVISGANGIKPGVYMGLSGSIADGAFPVALSGRVYVYANKENGQIQPGDFLTSSSIAGQAMKVIDLSTNQGAIIGKAMTPLNDQSGFVLVLLNLQ